MDQKISVNEISSCHEMEEMRKEAERLAVEAAERRMNQIIRDAIQEEDEIVAQRNVLFTELQNEVRSLNEDTAMLEDVQQRSRDQLQEMLDLQTQLTNVNVDTVNLLTTLQELRERNHAALSVDPTYNLIQEGQELQRKLDEMGIHVYPPTGSDQYLSP